MEFVPYEFCFSVAASLREPSTLEGVLTNPIWNAALANVVENRVNGELCVTTGKLSRKYVGNFTSEEIEAIDKKYLRVSGVNVLLAGSSSREIPEATISLLPYVNMADFSLSLYETSRNSKLRKVLSLFESSSIYNLHVGRIAGDDADVFNFIQNHLRSHILKKIHVSSEDRQLRLHNTITKHISNNSFHEAYVDLNVKISKKLFQKLFDTLRTEKKSVLIAKFSFGLQTLAEFREHLQEAQYPDIVWRRTDGVKISVGMHYGRFLKMELERES